MLSEASLFTTDRVSGARVVVRDLTRVFSGRDSDVRAIDGLDLAIRPGEFVCVLGPSGCGKTTLLNILAGFDAPTSGEALLDGLPILGPGAERGVVFQQGSLFPWMTVAENVTFGPRVRGVSNAEAADIANTYLELVGLQGFGGRYSYELSGGMQQRVGIARAIANDPEILLMDEPFAALDQQNRELLQEEIKRIWRKTDKTIMWITHSIEEALFLSDRLLVMTARPGRVKASFNVSFDDDDLLVMTTPEFAAAKREVFQLLREEVMAAQQEQRDHSVA